MAAAAQQGDAGPLIRLEGINKAFVPGRLVLQDVDLEIARGEVHALLGENGAGKSTLMNVLIGLVTPDSGRAQISGCEVDFAHFGPGPAVESGIAMVHQHSSLVPGMTVEENLCFGDPRGGFVFNRRRAAARLEALGSEYRLEVSLGARVEDLSVGQRQRAEILRALDRGAELLILDEPTAALTPSETLELFPALRRLRERGRSVIFISHKLDEVEALADRVTVLRRGAVVGSRDVASLDARELGRMMLGRELPALARPALEPGVEDVSLLELSDVSAKGLRDGSSLRHLSLSLRSGEVLGIAGIDGNGQRELEEVLAGVRRMSGGEIRVGGCPVSPGIRTLRRSGVAHLSGDRERAGLVTGFTLAENWILKDSYDGAPYFPNGWLDEGAAERATRDATERFDIRPREPEVDIGTLSGGNAQKLAVARELTTGSRVLIAVNPTRGLDVGSARFVHEQLLGLRASGGGVLLISTELDEVMALSDRILVLVRGELRSVPSRAGREALGAIMLGREVE